MKTVGKVYGVGVGPGDPELITIKGLNAIRKADIVVFHQTKKADSNALKIALPWLNDKQERLALTYPITTEMPSDSECYRESLEKFYQESTNLIKDKLEQGLNIVVLTEGDPCFYSSFMYILDSLKGKYPVEIIPGVSSIFGAAAALQTPLSYRNETFSILSGVLSENELIQRLKAGDSFAIIKIGRNLEKVRNALKKSGLFDRALYIERATMENQHIYPLENVEGEKAPYFSLILVPGKTWREEK